MKRPVTIILILLSPLFSSWYVKDPQNAGNEFAVLDTSKVLTRIAMGSCNGQDSEQPMWKYIIQNKPDLWIWLGDNIYGDTEDPKYLEEQYQKQKNKPAYQELLRITPVIGIWDDHDYGVNDGGKEYPMKNVSQQLLMDFLNVPPDAPQRKREGAYASYVFGKEGQKVKIILLDVRYFRDSLPADEKNMINPEGDMLGEVQWQWLERELNRNDIQLFLIGNGTQVIPTKYPFEKWSNFPKSRARLFDLLKRHQDKKVLLLSGDLHMGEIMKIKPKGFQKPVYELTASGLTHYYGKKPRNKYRKGKPANKLNFGMIEILWDEKPVKVKLQVRGEGNQLLTEQVVLLK